MFEEAIAIDLQHGKMTKYYLLARRVITVFDRITSMGPIYKQLCTMAKQVGGYNQTACNNQSKLC